MTMKNILENKFWFAARSFAAVAVLGFSIVLSQDGYNVIGEWSFSGQGTTLEDVSVNDNHATIHGATWAGDDQSGYSLYFDSAEDDYALISDPNDATKAPANLILGETSSWVVNITFKRDGSGSTQTLMQTHSDNKGWGIRMSQKLHFRFGGGGGSMFQSSDMYAGTGQYTLPQDDDGW